MNIFSPSSVLNFTGATININALSDTHGQLEKADKGYQTLIKRDAFVKEGQGKANFLIVGGDWFMSGNKTGYKTDPKKPLMKFQAQMYNKFVGKLKESYPALKSIFVPGNHDFDGGVELFHDTVRDLDADVVFSNLDFKNSDALKEAISEGKIIDSKITFVTDDKDDSKTHPVLNLGVAPINLEYYQGKTKGLKLTENTNTAQKFVTPEQYEKTLENIKKQVEDFKAKYPKGHVVLTCHTGVGFADMCAKESDIDLIFDGHEHKDNIRFVNGTPIAALSQNFEKIVNSKIILDDNGNTEEIKFVELKPMEEKLKDGELARFNEELFKEDMRKICTLYSTDSDITSLDVKGIRKGNSHLANFVTDAILNSIQKRNPEVQIFALNASAIRSGFKMDKEPNVSSFEINNCLSGINRNQGDIYVSEVSGRELAALILDNFKFNNLDQEKNPIMHYSGISIDRTNFMKAYSNGELGSKLCKYITLKETKETIDPDKKYIIANPEKYFTKSNNEKIKELKNRSYPLNANIHDLFEEFFNSKQGIAVIPETRIY